MATDLNVGQNVPLRDLNGVRGAEHSEIEKDMGSSKSLMGVTILVEPSMFAMNESSPRVELQGV